MTNKEKILLHFTYLLASIAFCAIFEDREDEGKNMQERLLVTVRKSMMEALHRDIEQSRKDAKDRLVDDSIIVDFNRELDERKQEFIIALDETEVLLRESLAALWR